MRGASVLLVVVGLATGLLLGEWLLGLWAPQLYRRPPVWRYDARLGWAHIPGASGRQLTPEFDVEYRINAAGQRDIEFPPPGAGDENRVLLFGDSFAEGWGVEMDQGLARRLDELMPAGQVLNFGVAGYGTDQELLLFLDKGRAYRPQRVIVLFYANDLWNNASPRGIGAERGYKPYYRLGPGSRLLLSGVPVPKTAFWADDYWQSRPWHQRLERYLAQHWHLFALGRKALTPSLPKQQQSKYYDGLYGVDPAGKWDKVWDRSGRILAAFDQAVKDAGARMLLVYVPAIVQVEADNWRNKRQLHGLVGEYNLQKPNERLAAIADQYGIDFLDLFPGFEAAGERVLYYRDSHWNAAGHALAARLIAARWRGEAP